MKSKLTLTVVMMALCVSSYAQDIIHIFTGTPIEAKIIEITDEYIRYKTFDNLDGPEYRISTSRVARIVFANGTEKIFAPADIFSTRPVSPYYDDFDPYYTYGPLVYRRGHFYDRRGRLYEDQLRDYLGISLYGNDYLKAERQRLAGANLTLGGGFLLSLSLISSLFISSYNSGTSDSFFDDKKISQAGPVIGALAGVACLGVGVPLWVKGNKAMGKIADDYNRRYGPKDSPTLSLGPTPSGLGLSLTF